MFTSFLSPSTTTLFTSFINSCVKGAKMEAEAVLFDLFNTLVLLEDDEAFYMPSLKKLHDFLVMKDINIPFEDFTRAYFEVRDKIYQEANKSLEDPHFNVRVSQTLQKFGYGLAVSHPTVNGATQAFADEFMKYVSLDDDALHVLERLHGKYKLGIVSNLSIPELVSKLLAEFGLSRFFGAVIISGAINKRKPSPEVFWKALRALGVEASRTIFVGDTLDIDIRGAKSAGLKAVLIVRKPSPPEGSISLVYKPPNEGEKVTPDIVIRSLRELLDLLKDFS